MTHTMPKRPTVGEQTHAAKIAFLESLLDEQDAIDPIAFLESFLDYEPFCPAS